jgi:MoxR-like ATPase
VSRVVDVAEFQALRRASVKVHVAPPLIDYAVRLVRATRDPASVDAQVQGSEGPFPSASCVALGASPRASMYLVRAARTRALLDGRDFATPHDLKRIAPDVLRHRVVVSYEAEADGVCSEDVVEAVLAAVETA